MKTSNISKQVCIIIFIFIVTFEPVTTLAQEKSQLLFEQAFNESTDGELVIALEHWNEFLAKSPTDAAALSNRGNVLLSLGDPKGAIADQTKAIELDPDELDPYLNRGVAEEALELWDEAIADYSWVLQHDSSDSSALYNLGNVMGSLDNWSEAEILFSQAAHSNVSFAMARSSLALAEYQLGEFDQAERELRKLIRKYPLFADARAALSALLWEKGKIGEAESNWVAVLGLDIRYRDPNWLLTIRRWPPKPTNDLMAFLSLEMR